MRRNPYPSRGRQRRDFSCVCKARSRMQPAPLTRTATTAPHSSAERITMQPAPLTGTVTMISSCSAHSGFDAIHTPHGDGDSSFASMPKAASRSMQPASLAGTVTRHDLSRRSDHYKDAIHTPYGDGNGGACLAWVKRYGRNSHPLRGR